MCRAVEAGVLSSIVFQARHVAAVRCRQEAWKLSYPHFLQRHVADGCSSTAHSRFVLQVRYAAYASLGLQDTGLWFLLLAPCRKSAIGCFTPRQVRTYLSRLTPRPSDATLVETCAPCSDPASKWTLSGYAINAKRLTAFPNYLTDMRS